MPNTMIKSLGYHVIQTNLSKLDKRLFSKIYLDRLHLKQGREIQDYCFEADSLPQNNNPVFLFLVSNVICPNIFSSRGTIQ